MRTSIDELKERVDFRIVYVDNSKFTLFWKSGKTQIVNRRVLDSLKAKFTWTTDF